MTFRDPFPSNYLFRFPWRLPANQRLMMMNAIRVLLHTGDVVDNDLSFHHWPNCIGRRWSDLLLRFAPIRHAGRV